MRVFWFLDYPFLHPLNLSFSRYMDGMQNLKSLPSDMLANQRELENLYAPHLSDALFLTIKLMSSHLQTSWYPLGKTL